MIINQDSAEKIAEFLLQIKAIKLQPSKPFTWASGWKSPIYCDNRVTLSYPQIRTHIRLELVKAIESNFGRPDVIAGVATGGIAQGALVAEALGLPFVYVRPSAKGHGMQNKVEGHLEMDKSIVVIEDLVSTGKSSLAAVEALREAGCYVKGMVAIFSYGFQIAEDNFKEARCPLVTLSNYDSLIKLAEKTGYITRKDLTPLKKWRENPAEWNR